MAGPAVPPTTALNIDKQCDNYKQRSLILDTVSNNRVRERTVDESLSQMTEGQQVTSNLVEEQHLTQ